MKTIKLSDDYLYFGATKAINKVKAQLSSLGAPEEKVQLDFTGVSIYAGTHSYIFNELKMYAPDYINLPREDAAEFARLARMKDRKILSLEDYNKELRTLVKRGSSFLLSDKTNEHFCTALGYTDTALKIRKYDRSTFTLKSPKLTYQHTEVNIVDLFNRTYIMRPLTKAEFNYAVSVLNKHGIAANKVSNIDY